MISYHIGTLDEKALAILAEGPVQENTEGKVRLQFLDSRVWTKAILHAKEAVSWDTRIFTFKLEHDEQALGLPTGQHLMIRLRDPVTREAIIRSYTPISHESKKGYVEVLVKVYFDTAERKGGKMSQAMEQLPIGHHIEFKGPIGKFEYLGKGKCTVNGRPRTVKRFIMICGGSGVTPVYQVYRAVMRDQEDSTQCVFLDGNRLLDDILLKEEIDKYKTDNEAKARVLYTLTQAPDDWEGLKGRIAAPLLREHAVIEGSEEEQTMALICGPEALEKSVHIALKEMGWKDEDLLFF